MTADNISILLFSDTHIGFDHPPTNKPTKNRRRGFDFFHNFKLVIDQAIALKVDYVIHCGDVFEKHNVPAFLVDQTYAQFLRLANDDIQVFIVPGNHERSVLPPSLFLNHPNIHLFDNPKTYTLPGLSISGFPYFKGDVRTLFPTLKNTFENNINKDDFNILCVHHAIDGVKAGFNFFEFKNRKDTLNIKDLPGSFDMILSGHIHKYQILQTQSKSGQTIPIVYSGSTERTMFDEINEIKGYHTLNIKDKSFDHQFHPIETRPMYSIDLKTESLTVDSLPGFLAERMKDFEKDAIVQIIAKSEDILFELSSLRTDGFFSSSMNVMISGFSTLYKRKGD
ncbi:DNA repair exonuclease SbcCD nuclease subunit [Reichenbachiella faecimaris]|uniref:DNA repair exonuclease SbcCD nuclease subunit n=1 Tax=Reichenbachiella faecimaris TaxID=692418 RepID=A0A1W2GR50_REIFA|nr:DNA repair exonuclease [Reichenbachiella faecimaris]SMD39119.1 DNA repair exonuclease SbcCD nuclease subunit [Reichenbachiella faecimaris]